MPYIRKTRDEFNVEQQTGYGWEVVCCEDTRREAFQRRKEYRENQPQYPVRVVKHRVPLQQPTVN